MNNISVIIIAKNEAKNIISCITSAHLISNDVIVADSGSKDETAKLVLLAGARLLTVNWKGYGETRNMAAAAAINDWILAIDADERVTKELASHINKLYLNENKFLYGFKRINYLGDKQIKYGEWGTDKTYRLYNKKYAAWNHQLVHETIVGVEIRKIIIKGKLLHYTMKDLPEYYAKTILYAQLSAEKYSAQGKKASFIKRFISPLFSFIINYIFRLGFLDGKEGFIVAYTSSRYIFLKYKILNNMAVKVK